MMHTETENQTAETIKIEDKALYIADKQNLLKRYKALADEIEYAMDDVEEGSIKNKRAKLALKIKEISNILRKIEVMEIQV